MLHGFYHTVFKASPGAAIFRGEIMFDMPFIANWTKIGECRQCQTDNNTACENKAQVEWNCQVGNKALVRKDGIIQKSESKYESDPWTIMLVHTNGTIRFEFRNHSERLNVRRATPSTFHSFKQKKLFLIIPITRASIPDDKFFLFRSFLSAVLPDAPIVGASDLGQELALFLNDLST